MAEKLVLESALHACLPGDIVLAGCAGEMRDEVSDAAYAALEKRLNQSGRNQSMLVRASFMAHEPGDASYEDIAYLCKAIYHAAGYRDQFEGLVLIEADGLARNAQADAPRLQALGEGLRLWASRAFSIVLGPNDEETLADMANWLDHTGTLRTILLEPAERAPDIARSLDRLRLRCSDEALAEIEAAAKAAGAAPGFSAEKLLRSVAGGADRITVEMVRAAQADRLGYWNRSRIRALCRDKDTPSKRQIGFHAQPRTCGNVERSEP